MTSQLVKLTPLVEISTIAVLLCLTIRDVLLHNQTLNAWVKNVNKQVCRNRKCLSRGFSKPLQKDLVSCGGVST